MPRAKPVRYGEQEQGVTAPAEDSPPLWSEDSSALCFQGYFTVDQLMKDSKEAADLAANSSERAAPDSRSPQSEESWTMPHSVH
eukprot:1155313-Pelagomonas_calceolata.AAC.2